MIKCERCGSFAEVREGKIRCSNKQCDWSLVVALTPETFEAMVALSMLFEKKAYEIACTKNFIEYGTKDIGEFDHASIENGRVFVYTIDSFLDDNFFSFPIADLFDDSWQEKFKAEIEAERAAEEKKRKEREEKMRLLKEERERQEYFRLGAKFGFIKLEELPETVVESDEEYWEKRNTEELREFSEDLIHQQEEGERK